MARGGWVEGSGGVFFSNFQVVELLKSTTLIVNIHFDAKSLIEEHHLSACFCETLASVRDIQKCHARSDTSKLLHPAKPLIMGNDQQSLNVNLGLLKIQ